MSSLPEKRKFAADVMTLLLTMVAGATLWYASEGMWDEVLWLSCLGFTTTFIMPNV